MTILVKRNSYKLKLLNMSSKKQFKCRASVLKTFYKFIFCDYFLSFKALVVVDSVSVCVWVAIWMLNMFNDFVEVFHNFSFSLPFLCLNAGLTHFSLFSQNFFRRLNSVCLSVYLASLGSPIPSPKLWVHKYSWLGAVCCRSMIFIRRAFVG